MSLESLVPLFFIGLFATVVALILYAGARQQQRTRENLGRLADELRLEVVESGKRTVFGQPAPTLAGMVRGRRVRIYSYSTGSGKNRTQWCAIAAVVKNTSGITLRISKENVFTRVGRTFGLDDVATGDAGFDRQFYLKSNKPGFVRIAFFPEIRERFANAWNAHARGSISADGNEVKYAETGSFSKAAVCGRFPGMVELVCDVCDLVETCRE